MKNTIINRGVENEASSIGSFPIHEVYLSYKHFMWANGGKAIEHTRMLFLEKDDNLSPEKFYAYQHIEPPSTLSGRKKKKKHRCHGKTRKGEPCSLAATFNQARWWYCVFHKKHSCSGRNNQGEECNKYGKYKKKGLWYCYLHKKSKKRRLKRRIKKRGRRGPTKSFSRDVKKGK